MLKKESIIQKTEELLIPFLDENKFELVDIEYGKEGSDYILRIFIDREGGIRIDDCELVSRHLSEALDQADFMDQAYMLEVSSPGLLRPLKKDRDFEKNIGREVELHLFKAENKEKDFIGVLKAFDKESVTLTLSADEERVFLRNNISLIRQYIDFSEL